MNTAVKTLTWVTTSIQLGRRALLLSMLLASILFSAMGLIIAKDYQRQVFIAYQTALYQEQQLRVKQSDLLSEQGRLSSTLRIERIAKNRLHMLVPKTKDTVVLDDQ